MRHTGWTTDTCCYIYRHMVVVKQDTIILLSLTKSRCEETTLHKMTRKYVTARWLPRIPWRNIQIEPWQLMNTVLKIKKWKYKPGTKTTYLGNYHVPNGEHDHTQCEQRDWYYVYMQANTLTQCVAGQTMLSALMWNLTLPVKR